jgi:mono/diheme cytochrome c family protein
MLRTLLWTALVSLALAACSQAGDALPAAYRQVTVPTARLASGEAQARGRALFVESCALCHGIHADGRGVRQHFSTPPQDFTRPAWQRQATPRELFHILREGKAGTSMAAWKGAYDEEQSWDLVAYLLSLGEHDSKEPS